MKSIKTFVAVAALVALGVDAQAGLFGSLRGCGASKCCDCAPTFQPSCCKPTITRPCHVNVYNYQRTCAKPLCCDECAPGGACAPVNACAPGGHGAACAPACACPPSGCVCAAPSGPAACCPNGGAACCPKTVDCGAPCDDACCPCVDPCEIAQLIYESQTACYAKQRAHALCKLGRKYDCVCNPEIMAAFIYGLNDADERVRARAAHEIIQQVRKNPCCCSSCVISALTCALADCDRKVRRLAERGLEQCGYDVVDGCCEVVCDACAPAGCAPNGGSYAPPAPMNGEGAAPAPAPPADGDRAYFPKQLPQQSARPISTRSSLSNLFGLLN